MIDAAWEKNLKPVLEARYPNATPEELKEAHAYAYGGCIIQDMGYYPFGSHFFTDLVHYVGSGDFVLNLIREARSLNEYAFALGSLSHYAADVDGHPLGVNRSVPVEYPRLRRQYGDVVTYEDNPPAHLKVEFSFDVLQIARGEYAPLAYHDFIGFKVATPVLERAFHDTYGIEMKEIFHDLDLALGTYRRAVSTVIPEMTRVAWDVKKKDLAKVHPGLKRRDFVYRLSRKNYHTSWDDHFQEPGFGTKVLALIIRIVPKIGPLKVLAFKTPTPQTERYFADAFDRAVERYIVLLGGQQGHRLQLADIDFDTGHPSLPGEYRMADAAYAKLAEKLAAKPAGSYDDSVRLRVLAFYSNLDAPYSTRHNPKEWKATLAAVEKLKSMSSDNRSQHR